MCRAPLRATNVPLCVHEIGLEPRRGSRRRLVQAEDRRGAGRPHKREGLMTKFRAIGLVAAAAFACSSAALAGESASRRFEWSTKSAESKKLLLALQSDIENFQIGPKNLELAKKLVAADP